MFSRLILLQEVRFSTVMKSWSLISKRLIPLIDSDEKASGISFLAEQLHLILKAMDPIDRLTVVSMWEPILSIFSGGAA